MTGKKLDPFDLEIAAQMIVSELHNRKAVLAFLGKRAADAYWIKRLLGIAPMLICADYGNDVELALARNVISSVASIEAACQERRAWSSRDLTQILGQDTFRMALKMMGRGLILLPYHNNDDTEAIIADSDWEVLANPAASKASISDKMMFPSVLSDLGLDHIPSVVINDIRKIEFVQATGYFGLPFVVQFPNSSGGKGTFLVSDESDYQIVCDHSNHQAGEGLCRISKFMDGRSPNINGLVTRNNGILVNPQSLQIIGAESARLGFGSFCGNAFFAVDSGVHSHNTNQAITYGNYLAGNDYWGIFGLDLVDKYLLEVNPRMNSGTHLAADLAMDAGLIPLMAFHMMEFLGIEYKIDAEEYNQAAYTCGAFEAGSQLCLYHNGVEGVVKGSLKAGVYTLVEGNLVFRREGLTVSDCHLPHEFVITSGIPSMGMCVEHDAPIGKIHTRGQILSAQTGKLTPWGEEITYAVHQVLKIEEDS